LLLLGITGTIGSGKSAVGRVLEELGVPVIDTDKVVHDLLGSDASTQEAVCRRFGRQLLSDIAGNGTLQIDRKALGRLVFQDSKARRDLETIVHPRVRAVCASLTEAYRSEQKHLVLATLVPLLFESGSACLYHEVWTVVTDESLLRERLAQRDGLTPDLITQRLKAQFSQEKKAALAKRVIYNSGTLRDTADQVRTFLAELIQRDPGV
jgi:dephospho-CoA kinase